MSQAEQDYEVTILIDACVNVTVRANSPEEAAELAEEVDEASVTLCNECADHLQVGDLTGVLVYKPNSTSIKPVLDTRCIAQENERLRALLRGVLEGRDLAEQIRKELGDD